MTRSRFGMCQIRPCSKDSHIFAPHAAISVEVRDGREDARVSMQRLFVYLSRYPLNVSFHAFLLYTLSNHANSSLWTAQDYEARQRITVCAP